MSQDKSSDFRHFFFPRQGVINFVTATGLEFTTTKFVNEHSTIQAN